MWYSIAVHGHNGSGEWFPKDKARFDIEREPWKDGEDIVVLAQRSIGPPGVASPPGWANKTANELIFRTKRPVKIRPHPGNVTQDNLLADIHNAHAVVGWSSTAMIKAITAGIPAFYGLPGWIGKEASKPGLSDIEDPYKGDREGMFKSLSWAMWNVEEIASGLPFKHLL